MNKAMTDLARRAVASPHWRWMPGMFAVAAGYEPCRVLSVQSDEYEPAMLEVAWSWRKGDGLHPDGFLPDLDDPMTVEAVGILAREAWGAGAIDVRRDIAPHVDGLVAWWTARELHMHWLGSGTVRCVDVDVRVACYVDALLAAPPREGANE